MKFRPLVVNEHLLPISILVFTLKVKGSRSYS